MFCSVLFSTASQPQFAFTSEGTPDTFTRLPVGYLSNSAIAVVVSNTLTASSFLQEHRYDITLMTSSSEEIHFTNPLGTYKYPQKNSQKEA